MAASAIFNFRKMPLTPDWMKVSAPHFMGRCIKDMRRWPRDQKCVDLSDYIVEPYFAQNTNNTLPRGRNGQIRITWKSKTAAAAIFNFRKNVNHSGLDKDICTILWEDVARPCRDDHVTKSRNRKLIGVTSSNERPKHKCVDLSDKCRYCSQICYRAQVPHYQHEWPNLHNLKSQVGGGRHREFRKKMSITPEWPWGDNTWPKVETGS